MRNISLLILALLCSVMTYSQSFNYQAVVRDAAGDLVTNQSIGVELSILEGGPAGTNLYTETHAVTSNGYGVLSLSVGSGTTTDDFTAIDWSTQDHWLDIAVDITGGTTYVTMGTSKLQHVPYALHALTSNSSTNAGPFDYTANVVSNNNGSLANDDFVFGSNILDDSGAGSVLNSRLFFDKSKSALRAGNGGPNVWDETNIGTYSVGFGEGGTASGTNSFSMGRNANATGNEAFAFGTNAGGFEDYARGFGLNARAFGVGATAIGTNLNANALGEVQLGQYSTYVAGTADTFVSTDRLFVIGNGQYHINSGLNSDALVMLKNGNTTLNGELTIDGDNQGSGTPYTLPAQDGTVDQVMSTDGSGGLSWVTPAADAIPAGGTTGQILSTDGTDLQWLTPVDNVDDADADPANEIELPTGGTTGQILATDGSGVYSWTDQAIPGTSGAFSTTANVTSNAPGDTTTDDLLFGATANVTTGVSDANRLFFDKSKGAFRAGTDIGGVNAFSDTNIGVQSVAFGTNNIAKGAYATASGISNQALGAQSFAIGGTTIATGTNAITMGLGLSSETASQTTLGYYNTAVTGSATVRNPGDRLFVLGNGTDTAKSDALTILKNGNTTLNGTLTIDGDNQGTLTSYTLPAQDGTTDQIMITDGSGNVAWGNVNAGGLPAGGTSGDVLSTDGSGAYSWVTDGDTSDTNEIELPTGGTDGQVLKTDGTGNYAWVNQTAASTTAFSTTSNVTSNTPGTIATDDFVFGSIQLDNATGADDDNRLFFDKSKGAFRAGRTTTTTWDDASRGNYSAAFGLAGIASGTASFAAGAPGTASGDFAVAFSGTSSGYYALSSGHHTVADSYSQTSLGMFNTISAGDATTIVATDRLFVVGNGTSQLTANRSDALTILKNGNTTLNGELTIDGDNQGAGVAYTLPAQAGTANQVMTINGSGVASWADATAASTTAFSTTANVTSNAPGTIATDDFVFGSVQLDDDTGTTDDDYRLFFDKSKGAFRAGKAFSNEFDDANVGNLTVGMGNSNTVTGLYSVGLGDRNNIDTNADSSVALGSFNDLNRANTYAIGNSLLTESVIQVVLGTYNTSYTPTAPMSSTEPTNRLFVIGNGTSSARSDALVILRNGNTTLNGQLTIDGDNTGAGASYTLPAQDGTASQVMTTDGAGVASWADAAASSSLPTGGTDGQVLKTNGSGVYTWVNDAVDDGDTSDTNEIELPTGGTVGQVLKSDGAGASTWSSDTEATSIKVVNFPTFAADLNSTPAFTSVNTWEKIGVWRSAGAEAGASHLHDNNSDFNATTGLFTAPVDGFYHMSAQIRVDGVSTGIIRMALAVSEIPLLDGGLHALVPADASTPYITLSVSGTMKLTQGQTVSVHVSSNTDATWSVQSESGFNGYLISKF